MKPDEPLLPPNRHVREVRNDTPLDASAEVLATRDHDMIRRWADARAAEPATGEQTGTGPATVKLNDGGAGIRFNFPGAHLMRPISWDEWFENFDRNELIFVCDNDVPNQRGSSNRYRIVKAQEWRSVIS